MTNVSFNFKVSHCAMVRYMSTSMIRIFGLKMVSKYFLNVLEYNVSVTTTFDGAISYPYAIV